MKSLLLFLTFVLVANDAFIIKRGACNSGQCGQPCSSNNCRQSCSSNNCRESCNNNCREPCNNNCRQQCNNNCREPSRCTSAQCNQCVSACASGCNSQPCYQECSQRCYPPPRPRPTCNQQCENCRTESCEDDCKKCDSTETTSRNSSSTSNTNTTTLNNNKSQLNVTMDIEITNKIENSNHIHNPIYVNSTNINNITVETYYPQVGGRQRYVNSTGKVIEGTDERERCCIVVPPKSCQYEHEDLYCNQNPYRTCSRRCQDDVIVPHPVPISPRYNQENCPLTYFNNRYTPLCSNSQQARQFAGTSRQFYLDPYIHRSSNCNYVNKPPWYSCDNMKIENCGPCFVCNGKYDPQGCFYSPNCSAQCRDVLQNSNVLNKVGSWYEKTNDNKSGTETME